MTLSELQKATTAFDDFIAVKDAEMEPYYKSIFPTHCECGGEVIMTWGPDEGTRYTQLQCCNPDCWIKMAFRFAHFTKSLGFKGFGAAGAISLYEQLYSQFEYPTFLYIFKIPLVEIRRINGDAYAGDFDALKSSLKNDAWQFKDAIAALGIPDIGKNSTLFDVVKDPVTFLSIVLKKRLPELCNMAGIYAEKTRYYLDLSRIDIVTLMTEIMPKIVSTPKREVYVAITGTVSVDGQSLTRYDFLQKCESLIDSQGRQAYKLVETKAESKLEYVIADSPSTSAKYQLGQRLNKLISAQQFYDILKENAGSVEDD